MRQINILLRNIESDPMATEIASGKARLPASHHRVKNYIAWI